MTRQQILVAMNLGSRKQVEKALEGIPLPNSDDEEGKLLRHHVASLVSKSYEDGFKGCIGLLEGAGEWKPEEPPQDNGVRIIRPGGGS